jgi:hypothetical protein
MSDKLKEALEKLMPAYPSKTRAAGVSIKPGWSEAEPQDDKSKKTERAKRAIEQKLRFTCDQWLSPTRGLLPCTPTILGFRFAPPQALCYRRASRAQCKLFSNVFSVSLSNNPSEQNSAAVNIDRLTVYPTPFFRRQQQR